MSSNSTTRTLDCLSTLRHLLSWTPQWWRPVSQHFSQQTYGLFLFLFRGQPNNLQLPGHKLIWSTVLPSTTQNLWYPTCLLDLNCSEELSRRKSILLWIHFILLSEFILRTISRPSFHSQPKPTVKDNISKNVVLRWELFCSGDWTRTSDLKVMSLASFQLLYPAIYFYTLYFNFVLQR